MDGAVGLVKVVRLVGVGVVVGLVGVDVVVGLVGVVNLGWDGWGG